MDIKFQISKIIDNGNDVNDWSSFIDNVKSKCDRDLLVQVYTVALNNITEKHAKGYKKLLIGLANLQSESSPILARKTFEDANALDVDCAVVCVYFAQFEFRHNKNEASKILRFGKCNGRTPKVLLKIAYQNLRMDKFNLFDGITDPWDEALHEVTDTITFSNIISVAEPKSPLKTGLKQSHNITRSLSKLSAEKVGKPVRMINKAQSASNVLTGSSKKSSPEDLKFKILGSIVKESRLNETPPTDDSGVFLSANKSMKKHSGPTLSPFQNNCLSEVSSSRSSFSFTTDSPTNMFSFKQTSSQKTSDAFKIPLKSTLVSPDDAYASAGSFDATDCIENKSSKSFSMEEKTPLRKLKYSDGNCFSSTKKSTFSRFKASSTLLIDSKDIQELSNPVASKDQFIIGSAAKRKPLEEIKYQQQQDVTKDVIKEILNNQCLDNLNKVNLKRSNFESFNNVTNINSNIHKGYLNNFNPVVVPKEGLKNNIFQVCNSDFNPVVVPKEGLKNNIFQVCSSDFNLPSKEITGKENFHNDSLNSVNKIDLNQFHTKAMNNLKDKLDKQNFSSASLDNEKRKPLQPLSSDNNLKTNLFNMKQVHLSENLSSKEKNPSSANSSNNTITPESSIGEQNTVVLNTDQSKTIPVKETELSFNDTLKGALEPNTVLLTPHSNDVTKILTTQATNKPREEPLSTDLYENNPIENIKVKENTPEADIVSDVHINNLVSDGLAMLGEKGFNMDSSLPNVPQDRSSKKFQINGKLYAQVKCIGKGGSCKVYEVLGQDGRIYALKRVKLQDLDTFMIESYINEIKWLEKLKGNPYIIELFEWEQNEDFLLILLEKGDTDLAHVLRNTKNLSDLQRKRYWKQMLSAVYVIHNVGIIHTDLKPANFLFVGPTLKLIDFGIANKIQDNKTSLTREYQMGTVNYMPPEALMADVSHAAGLSRISKASDIWSLGCMLYSMIFKKTPYQHIKNVNSKMLAIQQGQAIDYSGINDTTLLDCLQGCLKYGKRDRYTLKELLDHAYLQNV